MVFQNYALFPHMTVEENIVVPAQDAEGRRARARASARPRRWRWCACRMWRSAIPRELSGGQQQRIALARCLVYGPSIILMDEPLGALDKKLRDQMQLEIKRIHRELRTTIVYVTHDQEEAMTMSDRICLMNARTHRAARLAGGSLFPSALALRRRLPRRVESAAGHGERASRATGSTSCLAGRRAGARDRQWSRFAAGQSVRVMVRPQNIVVRHRRRGRQTAASCAAA